MTMYTNEQLRQIAEAAKSQQQFEQIDAAQVAKQATEVRASQPVDARVHVVILFHSAEKSVKENLDDQLVLLRRSGDVIFHDFDLSQTGRFEAAEQFVEESSATARKTMIVALISPKMLQSDIMALCCDQVRFVPVRIRSCNLNQVGGLNELLTAPSSLSENTWACNISGGKRDVFLAAVVQDVLKISDLMK